MIVLIAVDNQACAALSDQTMRLKFPDNTEFHFNEPRPGWVCFTPMPDRSDPLSNKHYYIQEAYIIGIMADDEPGFFFDAPPPPEQPAPLPDLPPTIRAAEDAAGVF